MRSTKLIGLALSLCTWAALVVAPARALAQTADAGAPPATAATEPAPPPAPSAAPAPPPGGVPASELGPPPTSTNAMPATREEKLPPLNVGAWVRAGARMQSQSAPDKIEDPRMDTVYAELHAGGKIYNWLSVTLNMNANGLAGTVALEDAIIGFDFMPEFHLWAGQLLVPVDRPNYGGPFFAIPWNYPGILTVGGTTVVMAPHEGPNAGRNAGAAVWGDVADGMFSYRLGAFDYGAPDPLISGRVNLALIGKEKGYFGNSTYFGDQDIFSIMLGGQYQKAGSVGAAPVAPATGTAPTDDYGEFNADVLAEFKVLDGGWITGEAAYYHFAGQYNPVNDQFFVLAAFASPKVGVGNIQPMVRFQYGSGNNDTKVWALDASVGYVIKGPALRLTLGFQHTDLGSLLVNNEANALQLGAQAIFF
jgi:hypothetical protein